MPTIGSRMLTEVLPTPTNVGQEELLHLRPTFLQRVVGCQTECTEVLERQAECQQTLVEFLGKPHSHLVARVLGNKHTPNNSTVRFFDFSCTALVAK